MYPTAPRVTNSIGTFFLFHFISIFIPLTQESDGDANMKGKQLLQPDFGDAKILPSFCNFYFLFIIFRVITYM